MPTEQLRLVMACAWIDQKNVWIKGRFHAWSMNHEQYTQETVGNFPVAIVEDRDGKIHICHADSIQFLPTPDPLDRV